MTLRYVVPEPSATTRRAQRRYTQGLLLLTFSAGLLLGVTLTLAVVGYRLTVATDHLLAWGGRLGAMEAAYERHHPKELRTTRAQAAVIVTRTERP